MSAAKGYTPKQERIRVKLALFMNDDPYHCEKHVLSTVVIVIMIIVITFNTNYNRIWPCKDGNVEMTHMYGDQTSPGTSDRHQRAFYHPRQRSVVPFGCFPRRLSM